MDALEIGLTSVSLGAGRQKSDDVIIPEAGIILYKKIGDRIDSGEKILSIHTNKEQIIEQAKRRLLQAIRISKEPVKKEPLIVEQLDRKSL
jgi:pyrimidine-nucleoside phosphorylase